MIGMPTHRSGDLVTGSTATRDKLTGLGDASEKTRLSSVACVVAEGEGRRRPGQKQTGQL